MEEHESEASDLELIAVLEQGALDPLAIHIGAVEGAGVAYQVAVAGALYLGMASRDRHIVEEDVGVPMAPQRRQLGLEAVAGACLGARLDDEQAAVVGEAGPVLLMGELLLEFEGVRDLVRGGAELVPARGAEVGPSVLDPPALRARGPDHGQPSISAE